MIVRNEEKIIAEAIQSFFPVADEIIVNDTGSQDGTCEILRSLPVTLIEHSWEGDFSKARNQSIDAATSSWILWLDADDRLDPKQIEQINALKSRPLDRVFCFELLNSPPEIQVGPKYYQVRMFPNHPGIRFSGRVHERILPSITALGLKKEYVPIRIHHIGYEDLQQRKKKAQRNLSLLKEDYEDRPSPSILMDLGATYFTLEEWDKAFESYKKVTEESSLSSSKDLVVDAWIGMGEAMFKARQNKRALHCFEKAHQLAPERMEPLYFLGDIAKEEGNVSQVETCWAKVVEMPWVFVEQGDRSDLLRMMAYDGLCSVTLESGEFKKSLHWAEQFLRDYPSMVEGRFHLGTACVQLQNWEMAAKALRSGLEMCPRQYEEAWDLLQMAYRHLEDKEGLQWIEENKGFGR